MLRSIGVDKMIIKGQYPVEPYSEWTIIFNVRRDITKPVRVRQIAEQYNVTCSQARRILDRAVKKGYLFRRYDTEWNGMFYIKVGYYW